jgi:hypothetical protein
MSQARHLEWEPERPSLESVARELVGRVGLKQAVAQLRACMHVEALARTRGSRRAAAALLKVDRRYVQRLANG